MSVAIAHAAKVKPLIPAGAQVETVVEGLAFAEGPAVDVNGDIYFTDIPREQIIRFHHDTGDVQIVRESSGLANGLMFDHEGKLLVCEGGNRRLTRIDLVTGGTEVLASHYGDRKLNSPNDLALDKRRGVYFTDPRYNRRGNMEMTVEGVYYLRFDGKLTRIIDNLVRPNGIILSADGKTLYVADHGGEKIMAYDVNDDGSLGGARIFAATPDGGIDGMTTDEHGRLYGASPTGIIVWDREGEREALIALPNGATNCTFAGPRRDTLYITTAHELCRIRLNTNGAR